MGVLDLGQSVTNADTVGHVCHRERPSLSGAGIQVTEGV
jgi:hypothetical protein